MRRGGQIDGEGLSGQAVWLVVTRRCALAGIDAEGAFSAHSLHAGFMTEAALQNVPLDESMAISGNHDVKTAMGYIRKAGMKRSRAATVRGGRAVGVDHVFHLQEEARHTPPQLRGSDAGSAPPDRDG